MNLPNRTQIIAYATRFAIAALLATRVQGWPAVILALVFLYSQDVSSLLRRLREVEGGGIKGRFDAHPGKSAKNRHRRRSNGR